MILRCSAVPTSSSHIDTISGSTCLFAARKPRLAPEETETDGNGTEPVTYHCIDYTQYASAHSTKVLLGIKLYASACFVCTSVRILVPHSSIAVVEHRTNRIHRNLASRAQTDKKKPNRFQYHCARPGRCGPLCSRLRRDRTLSCAGRPFRHLCAGPNVA